MRYGVVSDIHANIQAWNAVLRDMKKQGVDVILCLGDVIGYGPNPAEVLDSCYEHVDYFILGNHDAVVGNRLSSDLFNDNAKYLIEWTRNQLNDSAVKFFADMPLRMEGDGFACAHGELARPGRFNYIYQPNDALESFLMTRDKLLFVGHTHHPSHFYFNPLSGTVESRSLEDFLIKDNDRLLINVGSVGDPRDGNTTASYCIYDTDKNQIQFRQVSFDIETFRQSLKNVRLPITPFFLKVFDGRLKETDTIKDMKKMEKNQATEVQSGPQKIEDGVDVKTRRMELKFTPEDLRRTTRIREEKKKAKAAEIEEKKKRSKILVAVIISLLVIGASVLAVIFSKGEEKNTLELVQDSVNVQNLSNTEKAKITETKEGDIIFADFESQSYPSGWMTIGPAFNLKPFKTNSVPSFFSISGFLGSGFAAAMNEKSILQESARHLSGSLVSPKFKINKKYILVKIKGDFAKIILSVGNQAPQEIAVSAGTELLTKKIDVSQHKGKLAQLEFRDSKESILVLDHIVFTDNYDYQFKTNEIKKTSNKQTGDYAQVLREAGKAFFGGDQKAALIALGKVKNKTYSKLIPARSKKPKNYMAGFVNFEKAIMKTFQSDSGKEVKLIPKGRVSEIAIKIAEFKHEKAYYRVANDPNTFEMNFSLLSDKEVEKRAPKVPFGEDALVYYKNKGFPKGYTPKHEVIAHMLDGYNGKTSKDEEVEPNIFQGDEVELWSSDESRFNLLLKNKGGERIRVQKPVIEQVSKVYAKYLKKYKKSANFLVHKYPFYKAADISHFTLRSGNNKPIPFMCIRKKGKVVWQKSYIIPGREEAVSATGFMPSEINLAYGATVTGDDLITAGLTDGFHAYNEEFLYSTGKSKNFPKRLFLSLDKPVKANSLRFFVKGGVKGMRVFVKGQNTDYKKVFSLNVDRKVETYTIFFEETEVSKIRVVFVDSDQSVPSNQLNIIKIKEIELFNF